MKLFKSFLIAFYMLYSISGLTAAVSLGLDDRMSSQNQIYCAIYSAIWFIVSMTIVIYKSESINNG